MFVKFESLKFRNILSYGNDDNEVNFETGMTLISAKNGNGKCLRKNTKIEIKFLSSGMFDVWTDDNLFFEIITEDRIKTTIGDVVDFYNKHSEYVGQISIDGRFGFNVIELAGVTSKNSEILKIGISKNEYVEVSPDHLLYVNGNWKQAKFIKEGDFILTKLGVDTVNIVERLNFVEDLYDLQVKDVHEFYANGIVSHNSTIVDALSFCLYGKPYRKIKINDLINRRNKKKLYTECVFSIGEDSYRIVRTLLPNDVEIYKNNTSSEKLSSKKLNQEEINKIIGIDHNLFRQIIALSINYNRSFLSLEIGEKRDIIESIFNIKVFAEMLKKLKNNNAVLKVQSQLNIGKISILESTLATLKKQIDNIERTRKTFDSDKKLTLEKLNSEFSRKELEYKQIIEENKVLKSKIEELTNSLSTIDFQNDVSELNGVIKFSQNKIVEYTNQIQLLEKNTTCPFCNSDLSNEHKNLEISRITIEIDKEDKRSLGATNSKVDLSQLYAINEGIKKDIRQYETQYEKNKSKLSFMKNDVIRLVSEIEKEEAKEFNFDDSQLKEDYNVKNVDYKSSMAEFTTIQEDLKYNDFAANILSDQGIKSFFFKKLVPILNIKINHYLDVFELPVTINFNDMMEESITNIGGKDPIPYMTFSEGEKKRIDIAIMLSFIDTTKTISSWNCNLLMFDEILDTSTDSEGLDKIMGSIKQMTLNDTRLCSYIISHRDNDHENYNRKLIIKKIGGFSSIVK